jgi:tetratricopeptide (TPR) repeat protein
MDWISVTEISDSTWKELERMLDIKWDDIFSKISEKSAGPGPSLSEKKCFEQAEDRIKKIVLNWKPHESSAVATIGDVKDLLRELELQPAVERLESMCETGEIIDAQCVLQTKMPGFAAPQHKFLEDRQELREIEYAFSKLRSAGKRDVAVVFVTGPPACGKTQICRLYAQKWFKEQNGHKGLYLPVLLLDASNEANLQRTLRESLGVVRTSKYIQKIDSEQKDSSARIKRYLRELQKRLKEKTVSTTFTLNDKNDEWLVVVDGAFNTVENTPLKRVLTNLQGESGRGRILVAMQERCLDSDENSIEISLQAGFSSEDSLRFLQMYFPNDNATELKNVGDKLAHIPLSLVAVAEIVAQQRGQPSDPTWQEVLDDAEAHMHFIEKHLSKKPQSYSTTLYEALQKAVDTALKNPRLESLKCLFFLLGVCGHGSVPLSVVRKYVTRNDDRNDAVFQQVREEANRHFLLTIPQHQPDCILVHDTLHSVLRNRAEEDLQSLSVHERVEKLSWVVDALCCAFKDQPDNYTDTVQSKLRLAAHFEAVDKLLQELQVVVEAKRQVQLSLYLAEIQRIKGDIVSARSTLTRSVPLLGSIDDRTGATLKSLYSEEMVEAKNMDDAIMVLKENIKWRKKEMEGVREKVSKRKLSGKNGSGSKQDLEEFCLLCKDVTNLGYAYKDRGQVGDIPLAAEVAEDCISLLNTWEAIFSAAQLEESLSAAVFLRAQVYQDQRRHGEAAKCLKDLLAKHFGRSHFIAEVKRMYTDMLIEPDLSLRDLKAAKKHIEDALQISKEIYADQDHPLTAYCLMTYGSFWKESGEYDLALGALDEAQEMSDKIPVEVRPKVLTSLVLYVKANCYLKQERIEEACRLFEECLEVARDEKLGFGPGHPQNGYVLDQLGKVYTQLNRPEEAIKCLKKAIEIKISNFGQRNKKLCETYQHLETAHYECGDDDEAREFREKRIKLSKSQESSNDDTDDN